MILAVAHRAGSDQLTDLQRADALSIYRRTRTGFEKFAERAIPVAHHAPAPAPSITAWLGLLNGCAGLLARRFPPGLEFELQRRHVATLNADSFGPQAVEDALEFLAALAGNETFEDGAGI